MDLGIIILLKSSLSVMFLSLPCKYKQPTDGSRFNQIDRLESQYDVLIFSL